MKNKQRLKENLVVFFVVAGLFYLYLFVSQAGTKCMVKGITGIPCPSCGMTRSYIHMFHGQWQDAFIDHPLFWTIPIIFLSAFITYRYKQFPRLNKFLIGLMISFIVLFIVVYIYRMVHLFPHTEPLKFYEQGVIPRLYRWVR